MKVEEEYRPIQPSSCATQGFGGKSWSGGHILSWFGCISDFRILRYRNLYFKLNTEICILKMCFLFCERVSQLVSPMGFHIVRTVQDKRNRPNTMKKQLSLDIK
jgi:hypothetical protein